MPLRDKPRVPPLRRGGHEWLLPGRRRRWPHPREPHLLESGRNIMTGCADKTVDLSLARTVRLGGSRQLQFRVDAFNAFEAAGWEARAASSAQ